VSEGGRMHKRLTMDHSEFAALIICCTYLHAPVMSS
jgi:hypothetical protein